MKVFIHRNVSSIVSIFISIVSLEIFVWIPKTLFSSKVESKVFNFGFYHLSLNPWSKNTPLDQFFTPWFLWISGLVTSPEDIVMILHWITIVSGVLYVAYFSKRIHWSFAIGLSFLLASSPLYLIFQTWIGFSDSITFFLITLYLILLYCELQTKVKVVLLSLVLFLGMTNHFFQFLVIVFLLNVSFLIFYKEKLKILIGAIFFAFILYALFLVFIFNHTLIIWNHSRVSTFSQMWGNEFVRMNTSEPSLGTLGLFHGLWPVVILLFIRMPISILVFFVCYLISMLTYDTGRVFAILSTPILILFSIENWKSSSVLIQRGWILLTILSPLICSLYPLFYKWDGRIIYLL
ncbi:hypothetical protein EHQ43_01940 [Leptospira bouyouniensis]|uniref:Glycosyltransferase RgtA/B/C/D-like domain-containing protein n=1 Tax=Leptospira bouyouniensis TaxID=2484911 RepID=A0A7I0HUD2_9LEPT|nr:hypothetical protein [Leptospira bouyouniensis]TGL07836.1 hypothetical protein EHQ43_01940 [Leptospira bouyouniensis]